MSVQFALNDAASFVHDGSKVGQEQCKMAFVRDADIFSFFSTRNKSHLTIFSLSF